jgi:hypothetical protein
VYFDLLDGARVSSDAHKISLRAAKEMTQIREKFGE